LRVFVTGATGLLGANVVRALLAAGYDVRVGVRGGGGLALEGLRVERAKGDLSDRSALLAASRGCDAVVHCAAGVWIGLTRRGETTTANLEGTRNVVEAAREAGVKRVVHVSTASAVGLNADGSPADEDVPWNGSWMGCSYADSKWAAECLVREHVRDGLDAVIVNPTFLLGPWDTKPSSGRMILEIARGRAAIAPPGVNDFVDVRVVADSIVAALERGRAGERYILGGVGLSYFDAWTRIARVINVPGPALTAPAGVVRAIGRVGGAWGVLTGEEPEVNPVTTTWSTLPNYRFTSAKARRELGHAETDLDRAITDAWAWFRAHGYA
jgi:dihydroflavonol-4-reductase